MTWLDKIGHVDRVQHRLGQDLSGWFLSDNFVSALRQLISCIHTCNYRSYCDSRFVVDRDVSTASSGDDFGVTEARWMLVNLSLMVCGLWSSLFMLESVPSAVRCDTDDGSAVVLHALRQPSPCWCCCGDVLCGWPLTLRGGSPVPVRVTVSHVLSLCRA